MRPAGDAGIDASAVLFCHDFEGDVPPNIFPQVSRYAMYADGFLSRCSM